MKLRYALALLLIIYFFIKSFTTSENNSVTAVFKKPNPFARKPSEASLPYKEPGLSVVPPEKLPQKLSNDSDCFKSLTSDPKVAEARHRLLSHLQDWDPWMYNSSDPLKPKVLVSGSSFFRAMSQAGLLINGGHPLDLDHAKLVLTNMSNDESNAALLLALAIVKEKLGENYQPELSRIRGAGIFTTYYNHVNISLFSHAKTPEELIAAIAISEDMIQVDWSQIEDFVQRHDLNIFLARQIFNTQAQTIREKEGVSLSSADLEFAKRINSTAEYPVEVPEILRTKPMFSEKSQLVNSFIKNSESGCELSSLATLVSQFAENIKPFKPFINHVDVRKAFYENALKKEAAVSSGPTTTD